MPKLEILASGPGTGKTHHCIELFRKEIESSPGGIDSRAYFVLPNREHADRIRALVLKKGAVGLFNVHILTIQELAMRLLGGAPPRPGEAVRQAILKGLLEDPSTDWEYFSSVKEFPGFHALLSESIRELSAGMIGADELKKRSEAFSSDPIAAAKARDLVRVLKGYEKALSERGMAEPEASLAKLLQGDEGTSSASLILFDGFYHFTHAQKTMISALCTRAEHLVVTLTLPADSRQRPQVFELVEETRRFLRSAGFKPSKADLSRDRRVNAAGLRHLEKNLFSPKPEPGAAGKAVRLWQAETPREEIEGIALEARRLHRETDWHFSDMALILRDVNAYEKLIAPVFEQYDVPVHLHERRKMIESGLGRFVHRCLELWTGGWKLAELLPLLRSRYLPQPPESGAVSRFERLGFARNLAEGREPWLALSSEPECGDVRQAIEWLAGGERRALEASSVRAFRLNFVEWIDRLRLEGPADRAMREAIKNLLVRSEPLYAGAKGRKFSAVESARELQRALEVGLFSLHAPGKNRVQVYDTVMALPKEYRVVFIAGLTDQAFPRTVSEDAVLKDAERQALNGKDPRLDLRRSRQAGERYFFYMAATRARDALLLSHPKKDAQGRPTLPSVFVDEVRRCFKELPPLETGGPWLGKRQAERELAAALFAPGAKEDKAILAAAAALSTQPRFARVLASGRHDGEAGFRDPKVIEALSAQASVFSSTRLEVFMTCAFRYFAEHTLRLRPYFEDRLRLEMGTLLHNVLETHFKSLSEDQRRGASLWKEGAAEKALHDGLESLFPSSPLANEPLYRQRALMKRMKASLSLFARREKEDALSRGLIPSHFELEFGRKLGGAPAEWPFLEVGGVKIEGKIDRIDLNAKGDAALVVDYKLGFRDLQKKLKKGIEVQLPVYLLAVKRLLGLELLGAELRFLESGKKKELSSEGLEEVLERTEARVKDAVARLKKGDIAVRSKSCEFCDLDSLCRFERWKLVYSELENE